MAKKSAKSPDQLPEYRKRAIERVREDIMTVAARLLATSGHRAVSMQDIAAELGFTPSALYVYFDSKQAIFTELLQTVEAELRQVFEEPAPAGADLRTRLRALLERQLELTDRRRYAFMAFVELKASCDSGRSDEARFDETAYFRSLVEWFRAEVNPAEVGELSPDDAAWLFIGICNGFFMRWMFEAQTGRMADQADAILDRFFYGVSGPDRREGSK